MARYVDISVFWRCTLTITYCYSKVWDSYRPQKLHTVSFFNAFSV